MVASAEKGLSVPALVLLLAGSLLSQAPAGSAQSLVPLGKADKQALLDTHNALRDLAARGQVVGQPGAGDMMLMEWDDRLMQKAAAWVVQCVPGHDSTEDRLIPGYSWVGQNWAGGDAQNMSEFVVAWFNEYKDYTYSSSDGGTCAPGKVCGHYTAVVWSTSRLLGCAVAQCSNFARTLVCNYAPGGNQPKQQPYASGPPAGSCIGEYVYTEGSLCLRKDQCQQGGSGCRCAIQCLNGGSLDREKCRCACTADFYGTRCETPCVDPEFWRDACKADPQACTTIPQSCPRTCNRCVTGDIQDKDAVNPDGVVARVPGSGRKN